MKKTSDRRNFIKTAGTLAATAAIPALALSQKPEKAATDDPSPRTIYLNGCAWNRNLPGVFGQACYTFELRAEEGGTGVGTIRDDVFADQVNSQFRIDTVTRHGNDYTFRGQIISSRNESMIGNMVTLTASSTGSGRGSATLVVESAGELVVIAIIAVLIALLVPAVQR